MSAEANLIKTPYYNPLLLYMYLLQMIVRKLFCSELDTAHSLNDVLQKLEAILQVRPTGTDGVCLPVSE